MAGRKLTAATVVRNPVDQSVVTLRAGQTVPEWAADQVGDHLFGGPTPEREQGEGKSDGAGEHTLTEPPRAGRGSGADVWAAYADSLGVEVPDGASRDDIVALVDQHNEK